MPFNKDTETKIMIAPILILLMQIDLWCRRNLFLFVSFFLSFFSWLVWFYGISTIVGYLMPNPFL